MTVSTRGESDDADGVVEIGAGTDIRAVSRVAQILALFTPIQPSLTATVVAAQLSLNRTTAYRYCMSLTAANLLERTETGEFTPGAILMQLGAFALSRRDVLAIAPRYMATLSASTGATAVLSLWGNTGPVVSAVVEETRRDVIVTVRVGTHLSMETAQASIFLAYHPDQLYIERLQANLPAADRDRLAARAAAARQAGYAPKITTRGIAILAAPVFDSHGLCAALAVLSTRDVLSVDATSAELRTLLETAAELTTELGGTSPSL
jgi:DNA-binding IclR family transcriptional regulator